LQYLLQAGTESRSSLVHAGRPAELSLAQFHPKPLALLLQDGNKSKKQPIVYW